MATPTDFTNDERFDGLYATIAYRRDRTVTPDFFDGPPNGTDGTASEQQEKAVSIVERTVRKHGVYLRQGQEGGG
jgi:hypothetical protein